MVCGSLWQVLHEKPDRALLLPQLLRLIDRPHAGIFDRVEVVALLDRRRPLRRVVERGLEHGRRLQRLQERNHVVDFLIVEKAVASPGRHHRVGIVDAPIVDVIEQPFVLAARIADLRKIGRRVAREIGASGRTHHVAGETRATTVAVCHQLGTFFRVAGNRTGDLARLLRRRRRRQITERVVLRLIARGPTGIALPRALGRIALGVERHFLLGLRTGDRTARQHDDPREQCDCRSPRQNPSTRHQILPTTVFIVRRVNWRDGCQLTVIFSSAVVTVPSSSVHVNLNVPLSSTLA